MSRSRRFSASLAGAARQLSARAASGDASSDSLRFHRQTAAHPVPPEPAAAAHLRRRGERGLGQGRRHVQGHVSDGHRVRGRVSVARPGGCGWWGLPRALVVAPGSVVEAHRRGVTIPWLST